MSLMQKKKKQTMFDEFVEKFFKEFLQQSNIKKKKEKQLVHGRENRVKIFHITEKKKSKEREREIKKLGSIVSTLG